MTFILKEFDVLKQHLNKTVEIILARGGYGQLQDIPDTYARKNDLLFLTSLLAALEAQMLANKASRASKPPYTAIFYGAMLVVTQHIHENVSSYEKYGMLHDRLADLMQNADQSKLDEKPDLHQYAKFYSSLNKFLTLVFVNGDSRLSLRREHELNVPTKHLAKLMKIGYELEKKANTAVSKSLKPHEAESSSKAELNAFVVKKETPATATDPFKSWADLKTALNKLITTELADKNIPTLDKLNPPRPTQLKFLVAVEASLSSIKASKQSALKEEERIAVLAGAMYLVRGQIAKEYNKDPLWADSIESSKIHHGLTQILAAKEASPQDAEALLSAAYNFVRYMCVESIKAAKEGPTEAIRATHIFSAVPAFSLYQVLSLFQEMIYTCRDSALSHCVKEFKSNGKAPAKGASFASYFGGVSLFGAPKLAAPESEDEEDDDEHADAFANSSLHTN